MKASDTLAKYGLNAFGVVVDDAQSRLAAFAMRHEKALGASSIESALESLLQKMEAVDEGRSVGFRVDSTEAAILDTLIETGTHFRVKRIDAELRPA